MPMRPRTDTGYVRGRFLRTGTPLLSAVWTKGENALLGDRFGMQSGIPDWPPHYAQPPYSPLAEAAPTRQHGVNDR